MKPFQQVLESQGLSTETSSTLPSATHSLQTSLQSTKQLQASSASTPELANLPTRISQFKTVQQSAGSPSDFIRIGNTLYFVAENNSSGRELWKTNGTRKGTRLVKDINPGKGGSDLANLTEFQGALYFSATDRKGDRELWKTDGTRSGTVRLRDINPGGSASPQNLAVVGNTLFFSADDGIHGEELWKTDGTPAGTTIVADINPGAASSQLANLTDFKGTLFFSAWDGQGVEIGAGSSITYPDPISSLWKSDGTQVGTVEVKAAFGTAGATFIRPTASFPRELTEFNDSLFFTAYATQNTREIWKTDGTEAGTVPVTQIFAPLSYRYQGEGPQDLTVVDGKLFFSANFQGSPSDSGSRNLFKTDGTPAGTVLVGSVGSPPYGLEPARLTNVDGTLFFTAYSNDTGRELWKSDGSQTALVKDIYPGTMSANPASLTPVNGRLYFTADAGSGVAIWQTDGSQGDTVPLTNPETLQVVDSSPLLPRPLTSPTRSPSALTVLNGKLVFVADNGRDGEQLWALPLT
jgi:ELWxxDGT repeat protein